MVHYQSFKLRKRKILENVELTKEIARSSSICFRVGNLSQITCRGCAEYTVGFNRARKHAVNILRDFHFVMSGHDIAANASCFIVAGYSNAHYGNQCRQAFYQIRYFHLEFLLKWEVVILIVFACLRLRFLAKSLT